MTTDNTLLTVKNITDLTFLRRSSVESFLLCPRRMKAEVLGEGKQKPSRALITGTLAHQWIEAYLRGAYELEDGEVWDRAIKEGLSKEDVRLMWRYLDTLKLRRSKVLSVEHEGTLAVIPGAPALQVHFDVIFEEDDGISILDHKTDRVALPLEVWKRKIQPLFYTYVASILWPGRSIEYEVGYVMLGEKVRWKPNLREAREETLDTFGSVWAAMRVYHATSEWPERLNEWCNSCPVRSQCKTILRAHTEFLSSLTPEEDRPLVDRYLHAQHVLKSMEAKVNDLKLEMIEEVQSKGGQIEHEGLRLYLYNGKRREISYSGLASAVSDTIQQLRQSEKTDRASALHDRYYDLLDDGLTVKVSTIDVLLGEFPELKQEIEDAIVTTSSETPTLRVTGTNKR